MQWSCLHSDSVLELGGFGKDSSGFRKGTYRDEYSLLSYHLTLDLVIVVVDGRFVRSFLVDLSSFMIVVLYLAI